MPESNWVQPNQRGRDKRQLTKRRLNCSSPQLIAIITISVISGDSLSGVILVVRRRPVHRAGKARFLHRRFNLCPDVIVGIHPSFSVANNTCT